MTIDNEQTEFLVVKNEQEQFSIWPSFKDIPAGWSVEDMRGQKAECLAYIKEQWTDMRPRTLRDASAR